MVFGLSILKLYAYYLQKNPNKISLDIYATIKLIENDTLLFFF
jgi:hypothetical protein